MTTKQITIETFESYVDQINDVIEQIDEMRNTIDSILRDEYLTSRRANYNAYNEYGFRQLIGAGNMYDSSLYDIIDEINEHIDEFKQMNENEF